VCGRQSPPQISDVSSRRVFGTRVGYGTGEMAKVQLAGACGELIGAIDWRTSSLGPMEAWPASLRSMVADMLHSRQPMLLFWGPDLVQFYNDAFVPSFGHGKHPAAMGQPARECWQDAWPIVGAQIEAVMSRGEPAWHEDALIPIQRNGRMEEVFWTYSYSPAFDDDARIQGTLVIVTEVTGRVILARRLEALSALGVELASVADQGALLDGLVRAVSGRPQDLPFVLVCERQGGDPAIVWRAIGLGDQAAADLAGGLAAGWREPREVELAAGVAAGGWPEAVERVFLVPLPAPARRGELALVFGLSPRLPFDSHYRRWPTRPTGGWRTATRPDCRSARHSRIRRRSSSRPSSTTHSAPASRSPPRRGPSRSIAPAPACWRTASSTCTSSRCERRVARCSA